MKRSNLRIPSNMYLLYPFIIILSINLMLIDVSAETYSCMPCLVRACHEILREHFYVNLPSPSYGDIDSSSYQTFSSCSQLNMAIDDWIRGDEPNTCPGIGLAELACEQLVVLNQTQIGCNSMSMALDPSFRRRCESLIQCNIPSPERITRSNACQAAHAFVDALHFDMGPISSCGCKSCRLHACDGWSTPVIQSTNQPLVNRFDLGKVELYLSASDLSSGITCEALQHAVHTLSTSLVDSNNPHDHVIAKNATCFPLAKASNLDWGSRRCGLSAQLYDELDPVVFNELSMSRGALSWPHICPKYLKSVYSHDIAEQLMASGYCNSPTTGLLKFVANSMNHTISSTGPAGSGEGNHAGQINPTLFVTIMFVLTLIAVL